VIAWAKWAGAATILVACGGNGEKAETPVVESALYVASLEGDDPVSVALVVDGDRIVGYACGDDPSTDAYTGWFYGKHGADGRFELTHAGWTLRGTVADGQVFGSLEDAEQRFVWMAARARGSDLTGLYVVHDSGCETGVIVTNGTIRGAWCDGTGLELPVQPVVPLELVQDRLAVQVLSRRLFTTPVVDRSGLVQVRDL
jgi:hypothetical protein